LIGFKSISNSTYRWNISELAAFDDYRRPESKTKLIFTIILIFAIILIITVVTVGVVLTRKSHLNTEDLNIDEVERSMKHNEDESGNYSKL
jgi:flagellar basal body-associated protein FliL